MLSSFFIPAFTLGKYKRFSIYYYDKKYYESNTKFKISNCINVIIHLISYRQEGGSRNRKKYGTYFINFAAFSLSLAACSSAAGGNIKINSFLNHESSRNWIIGLSWTAFFE